MNATGGFGACDDVAFHASRKYKHNHMPLCEYALATEQTTPMSCGWLVGNIPTTWGRFVQPD